LRKERGRKELILSSKEGKRMQDGGRRRNEGWILINKTRKGRQDGARGWRGKKE